VRTIWQRARSRDEAIQVALCKIGLGPEWELAPNVAAEQLPIEVARR
jgi:hypothetical protein